MSISPRLYHGECSEVPLAGVEMADAPICPIVETRNFIHSIREAGYRTVAAAVAELVDNSIQAGAGKVEILVMDERLDPIKDISIAVLDDGSGMDPITLATALQFGGTDRFNSRAGMGRFGMGLPASSLSQARRVEVYTWRSSRKIAYCYIDVDEIASGKIAGVPRARRATLPDWAEPLAGKRGTLVVWSRCDRLLGHTAAGISKTLRAQLGRIFRYFLWEGVRITINQQPVRPIDPLFRRRNSQLAGAQQFGPSLLYKVRLPTNSTQTSVIRVRFSELPIREWHELPANEKRRFGIVKGGGVSIVRARREIAYGWYFMGQKRKENYDDWWRCEIAFNPQLDEYFRPTHIKQEIRPTPALNALLSPDLEAIARVLNRRVRSAHVEVAGKRPGPAARNASVKECLLPPTGVGGAGRLRSVLAQLGGPRGLRLPGGHFIKYQMIIEALREECFYRVRIRGTVLELILNSEHPFFEHIYGPICQTGSGELRFGVECLLFALARVEAEAHEAKQRYWYARKRVSWSNVLGTFLGR